MTVDDCELITLPKNEDPRGNLTFIEGGRHVPFDIKRVFYLYDVPSGADRGGHALKTCHQVLIAISGSFDVLLNDGQQERRIHMNRPWSGLHIHPMIWRTMDNFSSGSVCLVLASDLYREKDYHLEYADYLAAVSRDK